MAEVRLIETELTTVSVWFDNDGLARYARVPTLDNLPLSVVQRQYPAPKGSEWESVSPCEAYVVVFGNPN